MRDLTAANRENTCFDAQEKKNNLETKTHADGKHICSSYILKYDDVMQILGHQLLLPVIYSQ